MTDQTSPINDQRIGFHYYPDCNHYRESDLASWIPELKLLDASWIVLKTPRDRAIPEYFIQGLIRAGIQPILHMNVPVPEAPAIYDLHLMVESYAHWGVEHVILFDSPNDHQGWSEATWAQEDLVERFLDRFIPLAQIILQSGLKPVFPPLQRGGSYWDTSFLRNSLISLCRRKQEYLINNLVLSCYASTGQHALNWGAGGPERWSGVHPYFTASGEEDQCGFRVYEWYQAIARASLHQELPVILLGLGTVNEPFNSPIADTSAHAPLNLKMVQLLSGSTPTQLDDQDPIAAPLPESVLCGNFWLLASGPNSPHLGQSWFSPSTNELPVVSNVKKWIAARNNSKQKDKLNEIPIKHYLLLPSYDWGVADWHLDIIRPYIKKYRPTIGFSLNEAYQAQQVTVLNHGDYFSNDQLNALRSAGCSVEQIEGDGTSIATQLAER